MTLSADLAARTDDELVELFAARPDLLQRPPTSFGDLAGRLAAGRGAEAIVEGLDAWKLQVLEAIVFLEPAATREGAAALLARGHDATIPGGAGDLRGAVEAAIGRLRAVGLVWLGSGAHADVVHALDPVRRMFPRPFGLGPSARSAFNSRPRDELIVIARTLGLLTVSSQTATKPVLIDRIAAALADPVLVAGVLGEAPAASRQLFDEAMRTGWASIPYTYGGSRSRGFGNLDWLISHGFLIPASYDRAVVPREVAVSVRGRVVDQLALVRPAPGGGAGGAGGAHGPDAAAATSARSIVAAVDALCMLWGHEPAPVLRATGGVGAREVKRAAKALDVAEEEAAFVIELAAVAHLVAFDPKADGVLPTAVFDEWRALPVVDRWLRLVDGWQQANHQLSLSGRRGADDKFVPAMLPMAGSRWAVWQRETVLRALHEGGGAAEVVAAVTWAAPARWAGEIAPEEQAVRVVGEAVRLGVAGADPDELESWAEAALGGPSAGLTLQADLTAMAAGAVDVELAQLLDAGAEVVSAGAATVWRFSASSIRDALDHGWTSEAILELLEKHATKGVPQPLAYLIADVARTHGTVRVGAVACYLRSDDPAALADAVRIKGAAKLGLRIVAPTIAVAKAKPAEVLAALRAAGLAPAEEDATGAIVVRSRSPHRAAPARPRPVAPAPPASRAAARPAVDPLEVINALRKGPKPANTDGRFDLDTEIPTSLEHAMAMIDARFAGDLRPGRAFFDDDDFDDDDDDDDDFDDDLDELVSDAKLLTILYESIRTGAAVMIEWQKTRTRMQRQLVRVVSVANDGEVLVVGVNGGAPFPIALGQIQYAALTRTR